MYYYLLSLEYNWFNRVRLIHRWWFFRTMSATMTQLCAYRNIIIRNCQATIHEDEVIGEINRYKFKHVGSNVLNLLNTRAHVRACMHNSLLSISFSIPLFFFFFFSLFFFLFFAMRCGFSAMIFHSIFRISCLDTVMAEKTTILMTYLLINSIIANFNFLSLSLFKSKFFK